MMWIYNSDLLKNIESGMYMWLAKRERANFMDDYDYSVEHHTPAGAISENGYSWGETSKSILFQGTEQECQDYLDNMALRLDAIYLPLSGTKTEPAFQPKPQPVLINNIEDVPF